MPCLPCGRQWINLILSSEASEYNCFLHFKAIFKMFCILFAVLNDDKHKIYLWNKKSRQTLGCFPSLSKRFHWNVKTKKEYLIMQFIESHVSWQVCFHYLFWYFGFFRLDLFWQTRTSISLWKVLHWKLTDMIQWRRG